MPRRSAAEARQTRARIVARAAEVGSVEGLEGVTIGRLADDLAMSKAGVIGHFRTKEKLQLAAVEAAAQVFLREVWEPAREEPAGLPRLLAACDAWIAHTAGGTFPGGCFWTAAAAEFDGRPGPVRDAVAEHLAGWYGWLEHEVRTAVAGGELAAGTDPAQVLFELRAVNTSLNQGVQLYRERDAVARAQRAVRRILGIPI